MAISKKTRFEVFKRDSFTCQYCGAQAPNVILNADHIHPASRGGGDDICNLVTSCVDCNSGKSNRLLGDDKAITKQKAQLNELQTRREQLEMLLAWKTGLASIDSEAVKGVWKHLHTLFCVEPPEDIPTEFRKALKKFGVEQCLEACELAANSYRNVSRAIDKIGGICHVARKSKDDPLYGIVTRVRAALIQSRKHCDHRQMEDAVRTAIGLGVSEDTVVSIAWNAKSWTQFMDQMEEQISKRLQLNVRDILPESIVWENENG